MYAIKNRKDAYGNYKKHKKQIIACAISHVCRGGYISSVYQAGTQQGGNKPNPTNKPVDWKSCLCCWAAKNQAQPQWGHYNTSIPVAIFNRTIYAGEGVGSGVLIDNEGHIVNECQLRCIRRCAMVRGLLCFLSDGTTSAKFKTDEHLI